MAVLSSHTIRIIQVVDDEYRYSMAIRGNREAQATALYMNIRQKAGMLGATKVTYVGELTFKQQTGQTMPRGVRCLCWVEPLNPKASTHEPRIPFPQLVWGNLDF